jgi:hypothetical protein
VLRKTSSVPSILAALAATLAAALAVSSAAAQPVQKKTHLGGKPETLVSLFGSAGVGQDNPLLVQNTDGTTGGAFVLPPKTALVVTDLFVAVNGSVDAGTTRGGLAGPSSVTRNPYFSFTSPAETYVSIQLTGGALYTVAPNASNSADSANAIFVNVHGYLVKSP